MRNKIAALLVGVMAFASVTPSVMSQELNGKKVLYINSYHEGYAWSDGIQKTIADTFKPTGAELKVIALDTYRNKTAEHLAQASEKAKTTIDEWKPDVVIVSDDPVMKGVYAPFFKDKAVPFVFCGVNWDAASYGVPNKNITGMLEVCPIKELLGEMSKIKPGKVYGYLSSDAMTPKKDLEMCSKILGVKFESALVADFESWKKGFMELQGKVDYLIIGVNAGITGWDDAEAAKFVEQNTKVVSGSWHDYLNPFSLIAFNKSASEQGQWACQAAIRIMKGAQPDSIAIDTNKKGELVINTRVAKKAGIVPPFEMIQSAVKVIE